MQKINTRVVYVNGKHPMPQHPFLSLPQSEIHSVRVQRGSSNFWVCKKNPVVRPFKWNIFSSTFT